MSCLLGWMFWLLSFLLYPSTMNFIILINAASCRTGFLSSFAFSFHASSISRASPPHCRQNDNSATSNCYSLGPSFDYATVQTTSIYSLLGFPFFYCSISALFLSFDLFFSFFFYRSGPDLLHIAMLADHCNVLRDVGYGYGYG